MKLAGLIEHQLITPLAERDKKRWIFVTQDVDDLLSGKKNPEAMFPCANADIVFGRFCKGFIVSLTQKKLNKSADLKRLADLNEAWSMKLKGPGAGWRMFGRFANRNMFVGLTCYPREECAPWTKYNQLASEMIVAWETRFASPPLIGSNPEDYVSGLCDDRHW